MEEKKNKNQSLEISDEELDKVSGGIKTREVGDRMTGEGKGRRGREDGHGGEEKGGPND